MSFLRFLQHLFTASSSTSSSAPEVDDLFVPKEEQIRRLSALYENFYQRRLRYQDQQLTQRVADGLNGAKKMMERTKEYRRKMKHRLLKEGHLDEGERAQYAKLPFGDRLQADSMQIQARRRERVESGERVQEDQRRTFLEQLGASIEGHIRRVLRSGGETALYVGHDEGRVRFQKRRKFLSL